LLLNAHWSGLASVPVTFGSVKKLLWENTWILYDIQIDRKKVYFLNNCSEKGTWDVYDIYIPLKRLNGHQKRKKEKKLRQFKRIKKTKQNYLNSSVQWVAPIISRLILTFFINNLPSTSTLIAFPAIPYCNGTWNW
jgi:hypothetical protein